MTKRNIDSIIENYYQNYNEDIRLMQDKMHQVEFITTCHYIDKYLKSGDKILEVGAGTGTYSLFYADKGYEIEALELVSKNIEILKSKIKNNMSVNAVCGNALDLSRYEKDTFDITLVLGPLYHLFNPQEEVKAINEAIRVTKPNGKIFIAFTLFDLTLLTWGFQGKNIYQNYGNNKQVSLDFKPNNSENLVFNMRYFQDIKNLLNKFNVKILNYVATDGIGRLIKDDINKMSDDEFSLFIKYHLSICEREDLIGYSGHILAILEK